MKEIKISGASDDLLQVGEEELSAWVNGQTYKGYVSIKSSNEDIRVHVIFDGNWVFAVSHYEELSNKKPEYERSFDGGRGYSEEIIIEVENDAEIEFVRS